MTVPVEATTGADAAVVGPYLATALDDPRWASCVVTLIAGGKSNLTYVVDSAAGSVILRRPPLGHILPSAHDVGREYRVMAALAGTAVPVPRMLHHTADGALLGQPFFVMERVEGHICRDAFPPGYADSPDYRRAIGFGLVAVLADLHRVDPAAVGLAEYGRPDGYLARQLQRWGRQWEATRLPGLEAVDTLHGELSATVPVSRRSTIVHGDYRLDNTMLHPEQAGTIVAVLDWELSTLGDPIADLGLLLTYWTQADDDDMRASATVVASATALPGFPSRSEVAELYAAATGDSLDSVAWAQAFGFYKLAVICAGIVARAEAGAMVGTGFDVGHRIAPLIELGRATLASGSLH